MKGPAAVIFLVLAICASAVQGGRKMANKKAPRKKVVATSAEFVAAGAGVWQSTLPPHTPSSPSLAWPSASCACMHRCYLFESNPVSLIVTRDPPPQTQQRMRAWTLSNRGRRKRRSILSAWRLSCLRSIRVREICCITEGACTKELAMLMQVRVVAGRPTLQPGDLLFSFFVPQLSTTLNGHAASTQRCAPAAHAAHHPIPYVARYKLRWPCV